MSYYGVDSGEFVTSQHAPLTLRSEFGLSDTTRIIGMVAYMYAPKRYLGQRRGIKGHEDLIDAMALAIGGGEDLAVIFVGGAWGDAKRYEEAVSAYAYRRLGRRAIFLGTRADVKDLYQEFDVVVHPSHSENVGGAFESLLLSRPTIATSVGGLPELIRPGQTGWLVPPRNPYALRNAILKVLNDDAEAQSRAKRGRALALELGDVGRTSREVLSYYERVLETSHRGTVAIEVPDVR